MVSKPPFPGTNFEEALGGGALGDMVWRGGRGQGFFRKNQGGMHASPTVRFSISLKVVPLNRAPEKCKGPEIKNFLQIIILFFKGASVLFPLTI